MIRICRACKVEKDLVNFAIYKIVNSKEYRRHQCKVCFNSVDGCRSSLESTYRNKYNVKQNYNLSPEQYKELAKNGCAVCGTFEKLCVDHDHACCPGKKSCGKCVRGILCDRHNRAEGMLRGNPSEALALAEYMVKCMNRVGELKS